ncbi:MAG: hypothetical protein BGP14_12595 [Sphingobacteriales bacterium 44-15]|nr:MAG: hypothetical protein BGP14_12595 [Sphingobacteriales bacterium 44-15]
MFCSFLFQLFITLPSSKDFIIGSAGAACKTRDIPVRFLFFTAKHAKYYARLNESFGQAKRRKARLKGYI